MLIAEGADLAEFNAEVYVNGWHQWDIYSRLKRTRNAQEVEQMLDALRVRYIAAPQARLWRDRGSAGAANPARRLLHAGISGLGILSGPNRSRMPARAEPQSAAGAKGWYDDFDPALAFDGPWIEDKRFPGTYGHTLTYANQPGSTVKVRFEGVLLRYMFTKAYNRGIAEIPSTASVSPPLTSTPPPPNGSASPCTAFPSRRAFGRHQSHRR